MYQRKIPAILALLLLTGAMLPAGRARAEITPRGQTGCPAGTRVGGANLVVNGTFTNKPGPGPGIDPIAGFDSDLPNRGEGQDGTGVYPSDSPGGGGFSIQTGAKTYQGGQVIGKPFPGDPTRGVPASETYLYANPNRDKAGTAPFAGAIWRQTINGLAPSTTYNFFAYFDNLLNTGVPGVDPRDELRVNGIAAGPAISIPRIPDAWDVREYGFVTGPAQTSAVLEIYDLTNNSIGNDIGITAIHLQQCVPNFGVAKEALPVSRNQDGTFTLPYLITLQNYGVDPLPLTNLQVTENLATVFAAAGGFRVANLASPTLTVNPTFDGVADINLLAAGNQLTSSTTATISFEVIVTPGSGPDGRGPFENQVTANATAGTIVIVDKSTPGTNPDPDGDGDPGGPGEGAPTEGNLANLRRIPVVFRP